MVLGSYISIKNLRMVLGYFCALPSNIERLDARGAAASIYRSNRILCLFVCGLRYRQVIYRILAAMPLETSRST